MKKTILTFAIVMLFGSKSIGQINTITNLTWQSQYYFGNYDFLLQWDEPAVPHDEIIGYYIYRDNEIYRFQSERFLTDFGLIVNCGQDFMSFYSDGDGFEIHVTAVYLGSFESGFVETAFAQNNLLNINNYKSQKADFYPNPTSGLVNIVKENLTQIIIYDAAGKEIKVLEPASQLNLSELPKGIYFMKQISEKSVFTDKIIIE